MYTLTERIFVDRSGRIVPEDSPEAVMLLGGVGHRIPDEEAERLGLIRDDSAETFARVMPQRSPEPDVSATDSKARRPDRDKALRPDRNKRR